MSLGDADIAFARELFAGLGGLATRKMFGGLGIYSEGTIFAIMRGDGSVLLKGAKGFGAELEAAGGTPWVHQRGAMPYWTLPDAALDDPELACNWARRALAHL